MVKVQITWNKFQQQPGTSSNNNLVQFPTITWYKFCQITWNKFQPITLYEFQSWNNNNMESSSSNNNMEQVRVQVQQ